LGIIRIAYPFSDYQSIAIAYTRSDGAQFGEFIRNVIDSSFFVSRVPILLKLVKPYNLPASGPYFKDAWRLLVKSIYSIGYSGVIKTQFHLDVFQQNARTLGQNSVLGQPLLTILGLDRYCSDGAPAPGGDGVFDYRPGRTIDQNHGDIILPYLRPFDDGIKRYFASIGHPVSPTSNVLLPQLYDSITTTLVQRSTFSYVFKGSALHQ
jgi:cell surface protein SprA